MKNLHITAAATNVGPGANGISAARQEAASARVSICGKKLSIRQVRPKLGAAAVDFINKKTEQKGTRIRV
jgi:hypothetical protein